MNKRIEKRHKRKVQRAREQVKLSEPDVRTPEQIQAARAATRSTWNSGGASKGGSAPKGFLQGHPASLSSNASKGDA